MFRSTFLTITAAAALGVLALAPKNSFGSCERTWDPPPTGSSLKKGCTVKQSGKSPEHYDSPAFCESACALLPSAHAPQACSVELANVTTSVKILHPLTTLAGGFTDSSGKKLSFFSVTIYNAKDSRLDQGMAVSDSAILRESGCIDIELHLLGLAKKSICTFDWEKIIRDFETKSLHCGPSLEEAKRLVEDAERPRQVQDSSQDGASTR